MVARKHLPYMTAATVNEVIHLFPTNDEPPIAPSQKGKTPRVLPACAHELACNSRALCKSRRAKLRVLHASMWDPCQPGKIPATHNTGRSRYLRSHSPATCKTPCRQNPKILERQMVLPERPARESGKTSSLGCHCWLVQRCSAGGTDFRQSTACAHCGRQ